MINITDRIFADPEATFNFKQSGSSARQEIGQLTDTYLSSKRKIEERIAHIRGNNNARSEATTALSSAADYRDTFSDNCDQLQSILHHREVMVRSLSRIKVLQASLDESSTPPVLVDRAQIAAEFSACGVNPKNDPQFISYRKSSTEYDQYAVVNLDHGWRANIWMDGRAKISSGSSGSSEKLLSTAVKMPISASIIAANCVSVPGASTYQNACLLVSQMVLESRELSPEVPF